MEHIKTKLSVNINKIATLRNSRGGNNPDVVRAAQDCEAFGADGITVHPRPDERHIKYEDVRALAKVLKTEFNIEGNPKEEKFLSLVLEVKPTQVTLVPDTPGQLTSNHGWDIVNEGDYLCRLIPVFKEKGIRVSLFVDPLAEQIMAAAETGTDRVELYTEAYAHGFGTNAVAALLPYVKAAEAARASGLGLNAGHDLDLQNLSYFSKHISGLLEVSIGHALICDALYFGLENAVSMYKNKL